MTQEQLQAMPDEEIRLWITRCEQELASRAEQRRRTAIEQIRQIAGSVKIQVSIAGAGRLKFARPTLRQGVSYKNPADPSHVYVVGKGKPPGWFVKLRDSGKLAEVPAK
jgi:H-NS histone family